MQKKTSKRTHGFLRFWKIMLLGKKSRYNNNHKNNKECRTCRGGNSFSVLDQISAELLTTDGQISGNKNKTKTAVETKCQKKLDLSLKISKNGVFYNSTIYFYN